MITSKEVEIVKDLKSKKLRVIRDFDAQVEQVWRAWTESRLLDQWWAPRPWRAETKAMDFKVGGNWLYCMVGPDGERHWCKADFTAIAVNRSFEIVEYFCDENGKRNNELPGMNWKIVFSSSGAGTKVEVEIAFGSEADLEKIIEMGFESGFTSALGNLDELLAG